MAETELTIYNEIKNSFVPRLLPELKFCKRLSKEMILFPSGDTRFVDENRYGGNGALALDREKGICQVCGSNKNVVIHHNNGFSNELKDLKILCKKCHRKIHSAKE